MPSILPMALITIALSSALWIGMLWAYSGRTWRYAAFVPLALPLSAAVNVLVKGPVAKLVGSVAGIEPKLGLATPVWFLVFLFLLAPVFEELIKVLPAALPAVRKRIGTQADAFWVGMALGIGFGLGEAIYLAWGIARSGQYESYPWYAFTGFLNERLFVVFLHGFMTAIFLMLIARKKAVLGFLAAAGTHALLNTGAMLYQLGLVPVWAASAELVVVLVLAVIVFERIRPKSVVDHPKHQDLVYYSAEGQRAE